MLTARSFSGSICLALLVTATVLQADETTSEQGILFYETHIRPTLIKHCYACHSEQGEQQGDLRLDTPQGWHDGGESGPAIVPGDPAASSLILAVRYEHPDGLEMPPSGQMPLEAILRLEQWVRMGAPGPAAGSIVSVANPADPIAGKSHWAFQSLDRALPATSQLASQSDNWPTNNIDAYIAAQWRAHDLHPVDDATKTQLARRLFVQLTGLPPQPDELERFLSDASPEAVERLVERLLASPRFGEVWGRHWLDLARYADSNGLDENFLFREAWRYRNWVIDAVNQDIPYDRFLLEQIAGDLLPYDSIEQRDRQRIASGFLVIGPKVLLGVDKDKQRMDVADEQIDTVGRVVLGQTLGCARCHDHKFDPIPTSDYYALAGIFTSTQVMEQRHMLGQQRVMEQLIGLGENGYRTDEAYEAYWREHAQLRERKAQAESILKALQANDEQKLAELIGQHVDAVAPDARDPSLAQPTRIEVQKNLLDRLSGLVANPPPIPARAMVCSEVQPAKDEAIRLAGQFDSCGEIIPRGFLTVLNSEAAPQIHSTASGRLELARWLTDSSGPAGQLAARVLANRVWHYLVGRGLVASVDNFGRTGEEPTHPELLDYLAQRLIASGWSIKSLVREIATSRTFALSSQSDGRNQLSDPDNHFLWRSHRRRLTPESLRDGMLQAADQLDLNSYHSTVGYLGDQATAVGANKVRRRTDFPCRSLYLPIIRNDLPELFEAFDFANPHMSTGARSKTVVPMQGLFMLNDPSVMDAADGVAHRVLRLTPTHDRSATLDFAYQLIVGEKPTKHILESLEQFFVITVEQLRTDIEDQAEEARRALSIVCHALFASSRYQYLD
jgi:hypothetical protein